MGTSGYQMTARERLHSAKLLKRLTPPKDVHREYTQDAREFLTDYEILRSHASFRDAAIRNIFLQKSLLFGRTYLVAEARADWLKQLAPNCDAVATPSVTLGPFMSPPLVIIPENQTHRFKEVTFRSIVEHEFVHLNQALLGRFPEFTIEEAERDPLTTIFQRTEAEFEANFLQLSRWSALFPSEYDISLEEWCALRGYTDGLERLMGFALDGELSTTAWLRLLKSLETDLPERFLNIGVSKKIGKKFATKVDHYIKTAFINLADSRMPMKGTPNLKALTDWLENRGGLKKKSV